MTEKEAAQKLDRSVTTLKRYRREGKISFVQEEKGKKGSRVTYRPEDIEAFEQRFLNPAAWAQSSQKPKPRRHVVKADQREHEEAARILEKEFGLKVPTNKRS